MNKLVKYRPYIIHFFDHCTNDDDGIEINAMGKSIDMQGTTKKFIVIIYDAENNYYTRVVYFTTRVALELFIIGISKLKKNWIVHEIEKAES